MNKINFLHLIIINFYILGEKPVVEVIFPGLLGNRLFAFCIGKILAEELGFNLYSQPILGFPNTYNYTHYKPSSKYRTEFILVEHDIDINSIISNRSLRNIKLQGFFQRYKYLQPYKEKIRNSWLKIDPTLLPIQDPSDIVIHIRTQNCPCFLPFEYYKAALESTTYNQVFICIDEPHDPFLENFKSYNPIIKSSRSINQLMNNNVSWDYISEINLDDFFFICSFNKIILSQSTYAWWAGFLSNATEIYAPFHPNIKNQIYGKIDEDRYHYIETEIGH